MMAFEHRSEFQLRLDRRYLQAAADTSGAVYDSEEERLLFDDVNREIQARDASRKRVARTFAIDGDEIELVSTAKARDQLTGLYGTRYSEYLQSSDGRRFLELLFEGRSEGNHWWIYRDRLIMDEPVLFGDPVDVADLDHDDRGLYIAP